MLLPAAASAVVGILSDIFLFLHLFIFSSSFPSPLVAVVAYVLYAVVRLRSTTILYLEAYCPFGPLLSLHCLMSVLTFPYFRNSRVWRVPHVRERVEFFHIG